MLKKTEAEGSHWMFCIDATYKLNQEGNNSVDFSSILHSVANPDDYFRALCDEATDPRSFVEQSAAAIRRRRDFCAAAVSGGNAVGLIEGTSAVARLANRIIQVTRQEADNSEDPKYISVLNISAGQLQTRK